MRIGGGLALAKMRQRVIRVPRTPKMPAALVTGLATVRHSTVRAARATKIPAALAAVVAAVQQSLTRTARSPAFGVAMIACLVFAGVPADRTRAAEFTAGQVIRLAELRKYFGQPTMPPEEMAEFIGGINTRGLKRTT